MSLTRINDRKRRISRNPASKPVYQRRMLEALARGVSPTSAANAAGVGRSTAYLWRQEDREFAAKWDEAVAVGIDRLETEAYRRALEGSDKLLMFLLERRRPEVWARSKANRPGGFARSHDAGVRVDTKVPSLEEAMSRMKALGLPIPEFKGDYDAPRERSQSSVSASVGEGGEAIVSNGTQAARDTAPEKAAKSLPALTDAQQTPMTIVGEPERAPASVPAQSKDDGHQPA
jgi:hypothetical protein